MNVTMLGVALRMIIPKIIGEGLSSWFELVKPLVEFKWDVINSRINSMFELATQEEVDKLGKSEGSSSREFSSELMLLDEDVDKTLHIKGQMVFMKEWDCMLFLACPMLPKLENLIWTGLFVNDLSMHDYSRDIMLATTQEQIQMKMLLDAAEKKAAQLESQQKKLGEIMKKSDDLISQMLPKKVADDLAKGKSNEEVCEAYEMVTMLFSDIVTFTVICSHLKPLQVVQLLNNMYTLFDFLCDQNAVYKVETIGDAYLIVAGCPVKAANHAIKVRLKKSSIMKVYLPDLRHGLRHDGRYLDVEGPVQRRAHPHEDRMSLRPCCGRGGRLEDAQVRCAIVCKIILSQVLSLWDQRWPH